MNLPQYWRPVRLGDVVVETVQGFAQKPHPMQQGIPQLRTNNITTEGAISLSDLDYVTLAKRSQEKYKLRSGDVLFNNTNSTELVGKTAIYLESGEYTFSNHMTRIRVIDRLLTPTYLAYYLHHLWKQGVLRSRAKEWIGQSAIDLTTLRAIQIPLPALAEQEMINNVLTTSRHIRDQRRSGRKKIKDLINRLFDQTFLHHPERKTWPTVTIGEAGEVQLGRQRAPQYQTGRYSKPYLRVANVLEDEIDVSDVYQMDFDEEDFIRYRLEDGDILLNEGQSTELVGRPAMWRDELPECCYQNHLIRFRVNQDWSVPDYALGLFLHYFRIGQFARISTKTSNLATLGSRRFANLPYPYPPLDLQQAYAEQVAAIRTGLKQIDAAAARMEEILGTLSTLAFSGHLSASWREANRELLERAAAERDALLDRTVRTSQNAPVSTEVQPTLPLDLSPTVVVQPALPLDLTAPLSPATRESQVKAIRDNLLLENPLPIQTKLSHLIPNTISTAEILARDFALRLTPSAEEITRNLFPSAAELLNELNEPTQRVALSYLNITNDVVKQVFAQQRLEALDLISRFSEAMLAPLRSGHSPSVIGNQSDEEEDDDRERADRLQEVAEQLPALGDVAALDPDNPAHPRAFFWQDVPAGSPLRSVYNALRILNTPAAAVTVLPVLAALGEAVTRDEATRSLDTLAAAGLVLPITLEIPDPSSRGASTICLEAYRLSLDEDDALADFGVYRGDTTTVSGASTGEDE